jgi:RNA polymerase subunit RPABC4/transcription elongation factor Spt4
MQFFDKLGQKASEAYKVTADKTGKLAKEAKLKMKISELKSQINNIYAEIGKEVYEKHVRKSDDDIKNKLEEHCTKIDVLSDEIEAMSKECLELKDKKQCKNCYTEIEKNIKFCPHCGEKQEEETAKEVEVIQNMDNEEKSENANQTEEQEKTNLEKTVEVESDVTEKNENEEQ